MYINVHMYCVKILTFILNPSSFQKHFSFIVSQKHRLLLLFLFSSDLLHVLLFIEKAFTRIIYFWIILLQLGECFKELFFNLWSEFLRKKQQLSILTLQT